MTTQTLLQKPHVRITGIYLVVASLWILFSDSILYMFGGNDLLIPSLSILKGMFFVLVTSAILYGLLYREFRQRSRSQTALEQSELRFRKAVEEAPVPIIIFAEDGEILTISQTWLEITGYSRKQLSTIDAWTELAYGTNQQPIQAILDRLFNLQTRVDEGDFTIRCQDGSQRIWAFSSTPLGHLPDQRKVVVSMATDVTEQRQTQVFALENERLKASFQREQERNMLVQRIISALSHDLRSPLTLIASSADTLRLYFDKLTPEKRLEKLEMIERQVQFALEMLTDTVNMARGNQDAASLRPVNLSALCQISVEEVKASKNAPHNLRFINRNGLESVVTNEVLVSRILMNLLSNAIKYSPNSGEVQLELGHQANRVVLRVIDHGLGIGEDDLPHIFDPFYRAKDVPGSIKGTGLGLSIVKDCVERLQGQIQVESTVGKGTTFTVELPIQAV